MSLLFGVRKKRKNNGISKKAALRRIGIFLAFEIIFTAVTMPMLVYYGPFENIKKTAVGTFYSTFTHQYFVTAFLSQSAIERILGSSNYYDNAANTTSNDGDKQYEVPKIKVSHSDELEVQEIKGSGLAGKIIIVHDPTRVVVGYTSKLLKAGETPSSMAKRNGAIAAINGGGFIDIEGSWAGTGAVPDGFIMHDGKVVYDQFQDENKVYSTVAFTDKGVLVVGEHSIADLKKYHVKEAINFGPPIIVNGKAATQGDAGLGIAPRTAIGQTADGKVLLLVIDGRQLHSMGATMKDVQDIFFSFGAVNAVNLDGGSSTTMYYDGKIINKPSDGLGERSVATGFLVLPSGGGNDK